MSADIQVPVSWYLLNLWRFLMQHFQHSLRIQVRMVKYLAKILPRAKKIKGIFTRMGAS
jgi:hypothetical protein